MAPSCFEWSWFSLTSASGPVFGHSTPSLTSYCHYMPILYSSLHVLHLYSWTGYCLSASHSAALRLPLSLFQATYSHRLGAHWPSLHTLRLRHYCILAQIPPRPCWQRQFECGRDGLGHFFALSPRGSILRGTYFYLYGSGFHLFKVTILS